MESASHEIDISKDAVIANLLDMGFDFPAILVSLEAVGNSLDDALNFLLASDPNDCKNRNDVKGGQKRILNQFSKLPNASNRAGSANHGIQKLSQPLITSKLQAVGKGPGSSSQQHFTITENFEPLGQVSGHVHSQDVDCSKSSCSADFEKAGFEWEEKAEFLLQKHFGHNKLKGFQKEALNAWSRCQDCLILAATGSGKSLCFQLPALLSGKVVVVISPLISLMHDQCLKLVKHGISACFLGSGQVDKSIERRAFSGIFDLIYVCPETLLRLLKPLQNLAKGRGIALFAIDEVHCVSKWGHDFRPAYRCLSILRENFHSNSPHSTFNVPLMALTATATHQVREDILSSLGMDNDAKIVITSFFRPNLRFSVRHSKTRNTSSYQDDFQELIDVYTQDGKIHDSQKNQSRIHNSQRPNFSFGKDKRPVRHKNGSDLDEAASEPSDNSDGQSSCQGSDCSLVDEDDEDVYEEHQMTASFLEDEEDENIAEDFDVPAGEFKVDEVERDIRPECMSHGPLDELSFSKESASPGPGPSIIYTPTRKETEVLAKFLCDSGVKASAYHAGLPKRHLRKVHDQFHDNSLQVVVATIAFGMGIDKSNVRRIIHYGLPQSLDSYYQEAGRAGRDGLLADCVLYVDMTRLPSLLPSKRDAEQTQMALNMLSDCFRYSVNTSCCRAKMLIQYFGEDMTENGCGLCDVCVKGTPKAENLVREAELLLKVLIEMQDTLNSASLPIISNINDWSTIRYHSKRIPFRMVVQRLQEQQGIGKGREILWWRGFARLLFDKGFIRENVDDETKQQFQRRICHVKFPDVTDLGLQFLHNCEHTKSKIADEEPPMLYLYPEGDMLLSMNTPKTNFKWASSWRRAKGSHKQHRKRKRKAKRPNANTSTVRGRISEKLRKFCK